MGLAAAVDLDVIDGLVVPVRQMRPSTLIGPGHVSALAERVKEDHIDLLIVDMALSPIQQRNLERSLKCKVIDRTGLILEIFGARAQTKEGRLQVELAALSYQRSRLVRSWTHLERQRGGMGFVGGRAKARSSLIVVGSMSVSPASKGNWNRLNVHADCIARRGVVCPIRWLPLSVIPMPANRPFLTG